MGVARDPRRGRGVGFLDPIKLYLYSFIFYRSLISSFFFISTFPWFRRLQWLKEKKRFWTLKNWKSFEFQVMSIWQTYYELCWNERFCPHVLLLKNRYKTQQYTTAKQRLVKKGVQWFFRLCSRGTLEHNQTNCLWRRCGVSPFKEPLSVCTTMSLCLGFLLFQARISQVSFDINSFLKP